MSEWVDIVAYAVLIIAVWGWFPAWSCHLTMPVIADRNPGWLAHHPESERRLAESRWFRWSCLLWGTVSLLALLAFQAGVWPEPLAFLRSTGQVGGGQGPQLDPVNRGSRLRGRLRGALLPVAPCTRPTLVTPAGDARAPVVARLRAADGPVPVYVVIVLTSPCGRRSASPGATQHRPSGARWCSSSPFRECSFCS